MGWEALGRWFESCTVPFLFLLFFSYFFFSVEVKTIFTFRNDYSVPHEESRKIVFAHFASYLSN